jgi:hypothetical protein
MEYYPAAVIIEPKVSIKIKLTISIDTSYTLTENKEDIETKNK